MARSTLIEKFQQLKGVIAIAPLVTVAIVGIGMTGICQTWEWSVLDRWFQLRPKEDKDSRIAIVEIRESDINELGEWPISDRTLAELLTIIKQQQPRVIGLDLYRDLRVGDSQGQKKLADVFRSTPNLIGVTKAIGETVKPPPILEDLGQIGMADLVLDEDGKVRRALVSAEFDDGEILLGLGTITSLMYLEKDDILLKNSPDNFSKTLGKATIKPVSKNTGGYVNVDARGYQVLLNYRGTEDSFVYTSFSDVLQGKISDDLFRDRLVLIGATAPSLNDLFFTPYSAKSSGSPQITPGVYIHGNIASQMIASALDGRTMLDGVSETVEWIWISIWSFFGGGLSLFLLQKNLLAKDSFNSIKLTAIGIFVPVTILFSSGYVLFLCGWWLPIITPLLALILANSIVTGYHYQHQKKIAFTDGLTKIANRRFFDRFMEQQWSKSQRDKQDLAVILCDVDFFKIYNDTYGHQEGDACLQKVAFAMSSSIRSSDLAARYGGEEFVIVLPDSNTKTALIVANRIKSKLKGMEIPHQGSKASKYVSISMGIASLYNNNAISIQELLEAADKALYLAKQQGRARAVIYQSENG